MKSYKQANRGCHYLIMNAMVQMALCIIIIIFLPSVSRIPRGLKKKIVENCRSDHYS